MSDHRHDYSRSGECGSAWGVPDPTRKPPSWLTRRWWRLTLWLGRPLPCKFGRHRPHPSQIGYGFHGVIDVFCIRCGQEVFSVSIDDAPPALLEQYERLKSLLRGERP